MKPRCLYNNLFDKTNKYGVVLGHSEYVEANFEILKCKVDDSGTTSYK